MKTNHYICKAVMSFILLGMLTGCGSSNTPVTTDNGESAETSEAVVDSETAVEEVIVEETEPEVSEEELIDEALTEGLNFYYGLDGTTADLDNALAAFQKGADLDSPDAYYYIGRIHDRNEEYDEAKTAYEKAIELGSEMAKIGLGEMYLNSTGVDEDINKANQLFDEAISAGCIEANVGIGDIYQSGMGVDEDIQKAIEYFELASTATEKEWVTYAYGSLAYIYSGNYDDIPVDEDKINEYASKIDELASSWSSEDICKIGNIYYHVGNYEEAMKWYQKASDMGNAIAIGTVGWLYYRGEGVEADIDTAIEWYEKAGAAGDAFSYCELGGMYRTGDGVEIDYDKALEYYTKAADLDYGEAMRDMAYMYYSGLGVEADIDTAIEWYEKAGAVGDAVSIFNLGYIYENGEGVEPDYDKAYEYYDMAAEMGYEDAINSIKNMVKDGMISAETASKWIS